MKDIWRRYLAPALAGGLAATALESSFLTGTVLCLAAAATCLYVSVRTERQTILTRNA